MGNHDGRGWLLVWLALSLLTYAGASLIIDRALTPVTIGHLAVSAALGALLTALCFVAVESVSFIVSCFRALRDWRDRRA